MQDVSKLETLETFCGNCCFYDQEAHYSTVGRGVCLNQPSSGANVQGRAKDGKICYLSNCGPKIVTTTEIEPLMRSFRALQRIFYCFVLDYRI